MSSQDSDPIKLYMTGNLSLINNSELLQNFLNFGNPKTAFPRQKCSRDWERVKDQRKADDVV